MVWIVIDEDPWPDTYVPVYGKDNDQAMEIKKNKVAFLYDEKEEAIKKAQELQHKYVVKVIRVFYPQGFSKTI